MAARVIVAGAGSIGRRHAENLTTLGARAELMPFRDAPMAALEAALAQADALVIATATQLRLPLVEAAARAGVPVYVEKPLAFTPSGVEAVFAAAAPVAARSMVGFMMRWHPAFRDLAEQDFSDVFRFDFAIGHDVTQWRANWRFSESYAARPVGGGVLLDLCHEIDMAACLFPTLDLGRVESLGHDGFPGVDFASRIAVQAGGAAGSVAMDYLAPRLIRRAQICGARAVWDYDFAAGEYRISEAGGVKTVAHPLERNAMFLDAMRDFLALVEGRPTSGIAHLPRLDAVRGSCDLIARAWEKRWFGGRIAKEIA